MIEEALTIFRDMIGADAGDDDIDACVDDLVLRDRAKLSAGLRCLPRDGHLSQSIITAPALLDTATAMTGAARLHSPFQHSVFRMDLAGEHWRGFGWHQDHPYNMLSERSVTAWMPLTPTGPANGSIQVAPALSDRIWPVEIRYKRDASGRRLGTRDAFIAEHLATALKPAPRPWSWPRAM